MLGLAPAVVAQSGAQRPPDIAGLAQDRLARLTGVLRTDVTEGRIPGAVILVARDGQIALFEAMGYRDRAREAPMTKDAIFRIYSMTKPIVSVAAMMLVEEGRMQLSDAVSQVFAGAQGTEGRRRENRRRGQARRWTWSPCSARSRCAICCSTPPASPMASIGRSLVNEAYAWQILGYEPDQRRIPRQGREAAAGQPSRYELGIRPSDRRVGHVDRTHRGQVARHGAGGADLPAARHERHGILRTGIAATAPRRTAAARPDAALACSMCRVSRPSWPAATALSPPPRTT